MLLQIDREVLGKGFKDEMLILLDANSRFKPPLPLRRLKLFWIR
jgi:hypothetical protein